jgi:hypoxanthine phosphoribosyltransferase
MAETAGRIEVTLPAEVIAARVDALAEALAPRLRPDTVAVCLLLGGLWFAADLTRALARRGLPIACDALWLASYGDGQTSRGRCEVRAGLQRPIAGRQALVLDDVIDSGVSLAQASDMLRDAGASEVITAVFARKPWPGRRVEPDLWAWDAPPAFLVGYGMDLAGKLRGLPYVGAVTDDEAARGSSHGARVSRASIDS